MKERIKVIYLYDALCGWCYGFSTVISELYNNYKSDLDFEVISGGMIIGDRIGPARNMAGYIKKAYKVVEDYTGITFGQAYLDLLDKGTTIFSSEKPAIALCVFKSYYPDRSVEFASDLQKAINYFGLEPENMEGYKEYAEKYGIPGVEFLEKMQQKDFIEAAYQEFGLTQKLGVGGFPTVMVQKGEKIYVVARGYVPYEKIQPVLKDIMEEKI